MTIAEKVLRAKQDYDAVYEAGKSQGGGGELAFVKNMDSMYRFFSDNSNSYYLDKLNEFDLSNIKNAQYVFQNNTTAKSIKMPDMPAVTLMHGIFMNCSNLVYAEINNTRRVSAVTDLFNGCTSLKEIGGTLNFSKVTFITRTFQNCEALEKVSFEGTINASIDFHWSTKLTAESLESIVTHLSDSVTGQTITLPTTAESTYNAKYGEGAWETLTTPITNWTFAYLEV